MELALNLRVLVHQVALVDESAEDYVRDVRTPRRLIGEPHLEGTLALHAGHAEVLVRLRGVVLLELHLLVHHSHHFLLELSQAVDNVDVL